MVAARGWASAHRFPEMTPPGQAGLGSGGGSFHSACAVREAVYLTWPEPECWPSKHSLSYDTNTACSQEKYLKNANWQIFFFKMMAKEKACSGGWGGAGWGRVKDLNELGLSPELCDTVTHQSQAEAPEQAPSYGSS